MIDVDALTVRRAVDLLAERSISACELLESVLARLEETEPVVHAYVRVLADAARASADRADDERAAGLSRGPLHGIPVAVKDVFWTADAPSEAGSRVLRGFVPPRDATAVRLLREAGAVLVGKHYTHEFALGQDEPPTRNAWNSSHYPGGSSAGAGVSVAVGSCLAALGTDAGGSTRKPASLNGVVGLKPTHGRISRDGIIPPSGSLDHVGIVTRTVEDSALVLQALARDGLGDATVFAEPVPDYSASLAGGADGVRIGLAGYFFGAELDEEVAVLVATALAELQQLGATLVPIDLPSLALTLPVGFTIVLAEGAASHVQWLRERGGDYVPATRQLLETGLLLPWSYIDAAQRARALICREVRDAFLEHRLDALAAPTLPRTSFPMDLIVPGEEPYWTKLIPYSIPANLTGLPAISVPCGFTSAALPVGLQILGRPFDEALVLRVAHAYQQATPWHERRPAPVAGAA